MKECARSDLMDRGGLEIVQALLQRVGASLTLAKLEVYEKAALEVAPEAAGCGGLLVLEELTLLQKRVKAVQAVLPIVQWLEQRRSVRLHMLHSSPTADLEAALVSADKLGAAAAASEVAYRMLLVAVIGRLCGCEAEVPITHKALPGCWEGGALVGPQ